MSEAAYVDDPRQVKEQACEWVARLDAELDDGQRAELDAWLAMHPSHSEALGKLVRLWVDMDRLQELAALSPLLNFKAKPGPSRRSWNLLHGRD